MNATTRFTKHSHTVIGCLLLLTLTACSAEGREPEHYLLPEGYQGSFYIVFNIPEGSPQTYEDGARVYDIPEDGVLLMQSDSNPGSISSDKVNFFYESGDGTREKIDGRFTTTLHDTPEARSDNQTYIFGGGIVERQYEKRHCNIYYKEYYVGSKTQALEQIGDFDLLSDQGINDMPSEIFLEACNDGQP